MDSTSDDLSFRQCWQRLHPFKVNYRQQPAPLGGRWGTQSTSRSLWNRPDVISSGCHWQPRHQQMRRMPAQPSAYFCNWSGPYETCPHTHKSAATVCINSLDTAFLLSTTRFCHVDNLCHCAVCMADQMTCHNQFHSLIHISACTHKFAFSYLHSTYISDTIMLNE